MSPVAADFASPVRAPGPDGALVVELDVVDVVLGVVVEADGETFFLEEPQPAAAKSAAMSARAASRSQHACPVRTGLGYLGKGVESSRPK